MSRPWLEGLNPAQRTAVQHRGAALRIVAGAGTGKTRTLAARVADLIEDGMPPERILLLTFTRRAAAEMIGRAGAMVPDRSATRVWAGTFHSAGSRLLRRYGSRIGLDPAFTVLDQSDTVELMGLVRAQLGTGDRRFPTAGTMASMLSKAVNAQRPVSEVVRASFPWCEDHLEQMLPMMEAYQARKRHRRLLDFDDVLLYWRALVAAPIGGQLRESFDEILVDEYQDTNTVQAEILQGMAGPTTAATVVGDDAQAIYGFRSATVENLAEFPQRFPGAVTIVLEDNYRSRQPILDLANGVMADASGVVTKELAADRGGGVSPSLVTCADELAQSIWVADRILELREQGVPLVRQAVLFRAGHHAEGLELELARRDIPYIKFGGLRYLEAAHIKDALAVLRVAENVHDEVAWHRLLKTLDGVGPATALRVTEEIGVGDSDEVLSRFAAAVPSLPAPARDHGEMLAGVLVAGAAETSAAGSLALALPFLQASFPTRYENAAARLADLDRLVELAVDHGTRASFLADVTLDPPAVTSELAGQPHLDDDYLVLSTIHSAKGGEWDAVYVIHAADGNLPSDMALDTPEGLEEERRLFYVALTRARDHLAVTVPLRYHHQRFGHSPQHNLAQRSRFLDGVAHLFDTEEPEGRPVELTGLDPVERVMLDVLR